MRLPNERLAVQRVTERLAELLGLAATDAQILELPEVPYADAVMDLGGFTFIIEWKGVGGLSQVSSAVQQVRKYASVLGERAVPLVAVPFMGPVGRDHCREAGVGWVDLSGNAYIFAPGIRVRIDGQPNRFKRPGRPSTAFAPKSSRIARWLLIHPGHSMTQREIAQATDVDEGFTSRIVAKLEDDELIVREPGGAIRARDPDLLLDAWREDYDFSKHEIIRGHIAARSSAVLLQRLTGELRGQDSEHAATGLAAAWLLNRFADFRIVAVYVAERPAARVRERMGFREGAPGANVWLVIPDDEGVFHGADELDGVRCVHPVQAYLDLEGHPERANEAATQLRAELLTWKRDG